MNSKELSVAKTNTSFNFDIDELENILKSSKYANKKVCVYCIAGAFRTGKSWLLNFAVEDLEKRSSGKGGLCVEKGLLLDKISWRGGEERHTTGITFWKEPFILKDKEGEEIVVLLMDTQGLWDHESTLHDCTVIFALSMLISSVQERVQEDHLNALILFIEYALLAQEEDDNAAFQKLLFLVRDFSNWKEYPFGFEGGKRFIDKISKKQKKELQDVRKNIRKCFESIECFLMPHPGQKIAENNSEERLGEVDERLKEQMETLIHALFENIEPKKIAGRPITCAELVHLIKNYIEIFNSNELPEAKSILEATIEASYTAALEDARAEYSRIIDEYMIANPDVCDEKGLLEAHTTAMAIVLELFEKPKIGGKQNEETSRHQLIDFTQEKLRGHRLRIAERCRLRGMEVRMQYELSCAAEEREILGRQKEMLEDHLRQMEEKQRTQMGELEEMKLHVAKQQCSVEEDRQKLRREEMEFEERRREFESEESRERSARMWDTITQTAKAFATAALIYTQNNRENLDGMRLRSDRRRRNSNEEDD